MTALQACREGWRRVKRFPTLLIWIYLANLLLTLPLAVTMTGILRSSIGASAYHQTLRDGFDMNWYGEFQAEASGLASSFAPQIIGGLAVAENLDSLLHGSFLSLDPVLLGTALLFLLVWVFFTGGILGAYLSPGTRLTREGLFAGSSHYFFRLFRMALLTLLLYWLIYRLVTRPLGNLITAWSVDVTVERTVLLWHLGALLVTLLLAALVSMAADYGRILTVAEDRRSMVLAFYRGGQFIFRHSAAACGLYLLLSLVFAAAAALYGWLAPGPAQSHWFTVSAVFVLGQLWVLLRIGIKLLFLASQSALLQELATPQKRLHIATHHAQPETTSTSPDVVQLS